MPVQARLLCEPDALLSMAQYVVNATQDLSDLLQAVRREATDDLPRTWEGVAYQAFAADVEQVVAGAVPYLTQLGLVGQALADAALRYCEADVHRLDPTPVEMVVALPATAAVQP